MFRYPGKLFPADMCEVQRLETAKINQNFVFFLVFCKKILKNFFDAAAKNDAGGDEKLIIFFTWPYISI